MTYRPETNPGDSHHERLIRVEERLKHMDETQGIALRELKSAIVELASAKKLEDVETRNRLVALELATSKMATKEEVQIERDRTNKIYWLWGAAVFIGTPIMMALSKFVFAKLGL